VKECSFSTDEIARLHCSFIECIYENGHWEVDIWGSSVACNLPFFYFVLQISIVDCPSRL
jgi:hypothetical protein